MTGGKRKSPEGTAAEGMTRGEGSSGGRGPINLLEMERERKKRDKQRRRSGGGDGGQGSSGRPVPNPPPAGLGMIHALLNVKGS